jgi:hypothetical protein
MLLDIQIFCVKTPGESTEKLPRPNHRIWTTVRLVHNRARAVHVRPNSHVEADASMNRVRPAEISSLKNCGVKPQGGG